MRPPSHLSALAPALLTDVAPLACQAITKINAKMHAREEELRSEDALLDHFDCQDREAPLGQDEGYAPACLTQPDLRVDSARLGSGR